MLRCISAVLFALRGPYRLEGNRMLIDVDTAWTEVWAGKQPGKTLTSRSVWEKVD